MAVYLFVLTPAPDSPADGSYGRFEGPLDLDAINRYLAKGSLVALRPLPDTTSRELEASIERVARHVVNAALAVWPDCLGRRHAPAVVSRARLLGIRAVVWNPEPMADALREQLTDRAGWPEALIQWIRRRRISTGHKTEDLLRTLAGHAGGFRTLAALAKCHGPHERTWRRAFHQAGLGSAARWHGVIRMVAIGLRLQRDPWTSIERTALQLGFSSASALSDRFHEVIGARPSLARWRLGWQWMLADGLGRPGVMKSEGTRHTAE